MEQAIQERDVEAQLAARGLELESFQPLTGDVSSRRYARVHVHDHGVAIFASYPAELREACARFRATTALFESLEVRVPRILAVDCEQGWMLVEDGGQATLYDRQERQPLEELQPFYERAVEISRTVAQLPVDRAADLNPPLDSALLRKELEQTMRLFLVPRGFAPEGAPEEELRSTLAELCDRLGSQPLLPCHRDFMARNLIPGPDGELWVIDHQDLRLGPPLYDLASLLNDSFFPGPALEAQLRNPAIVSPEDEASYHRAAAQRTLKAVGTFASFAKHGSSRHLPLISPTLMRAVDHLEKLPEAVGLARRLRPKWSQALAEASDLRST